jgi:hypothetical protein
MLSGQKQSRNSSAEKNGIKEKAKKRDSRTILFALQDYKCSMSFTTLHLNIFTPIVDKEKAFDMKERVIKIQTKSKFLHGPHRPTHLRRFTIEILLDSLTSHQLYHSESHFPHSDFHP